ncbi:MAG TPA: sulfotransferase [Terriglobia bacterium]|nr:sulfotransferase [Terriglobia bacterium]
MKPPVFIVGCPRSGTSFLYHLLISAGGFAEFHTQMNVYDVLEPIYGDLGDLKNKQRMMKEWLQSKAFRVSGLDAVEIETKVRAECRGTSDFLRIVMDEVARRQEVDRWADSTPTNAPHMLRIQRDFPEARFVHIVRDPRDVALSLDRRGWSRPLPWDRKRSLLAAGLYWEWIVRKGRAYGARLGPHYLEVRYEDLVDRPREELARVCEFIQHDLDYDHVQRTRIGSVRTPLTAFKEDLARGIFQPVGRWKNSFPPDQLRWFESLVGDYMQELGYQLSGAGGPAPNPVAVRGVRLLYGAYHESKQWAKVHTPLTRYFVSYSAILIDK